MARRLVFGARRFVQHCSPERTRSGGDNVPSTWGRFRLLSAGVSHPFSACEEPSKAMSSVDGVCSHGPYGGVLFFSPFFEPLRRCPDRFDPKKVGIPVLWVLMDKHRVRSYSISCRTSTICCSIPCRSVPMDCFDRASADAAGLSRSTEQCHQCHRLHWLLKGIG